MGKSVKNELADDGLTSLKYQKVDQKEFPLYTWILVKVPKGKQFKKRIAIQQALLNVTYYDISWIIRLRNNY